MTFGPAIGTRGAIVVGAGGPFLVTGAALIIGAGMNTGGGDISGRGSSITASRTGAGIGGGATWAGMKVSLGDSSIRGISCTSAGFRTSSVTSARAFPSATTNGSAP
jgi:hypothetical protein